MLESNDLFRYVKSCVNSISRHQTGDAYIECILAATEKQISEYKHDIWEKEYLDLLLAPHFISIEDFEEDTLLVLIIFIIYNSRANEMNSFKLDYIDSIARSFLDARVNPDKYDLYLNMFFDQNIYSSFASMGNEVSVRAMTRIIESVTPEELAIGNYDAARDIIKNYRSSLFLNLGNNPDSFKDLYEAVAVYMYSKKYEDKFSDYDFYAFSILEDLDSRLSSEMKKELTRKILNVESGVTGEPILLIKLILKQVCEFYGTEVLGFKPQNEGDTIKF